VGLRAGLDAMEKSAPAGNRTLVVLVQSVAQPLYRLRYSAPNISIVDRIDRHY
jgi:hypothetical protein